MVLSGLSVLSWASCSSNCILLISFLLNCFKGKQLEEKYLFSLVFLFKYSRVDIAHLCLYNLSVIHKKKYFDSELELMAYINENWDRLHPGEVSKWNTLSCF